MKEILLFAMAVLVSGLLVADGRMAGRTDPTRESSGVSRESTGLLRRGDTLVLVGDSITYLGYINESGWYHQLTNAFERFVPEKQINVVPLGYSGFRVQTWNDCWGRIDTPKGWRTYYGDSRQNWDHRDVWSNNVGVVAIFLGMNDILKPTLVGSDKEIHRWKESVRTLVNNIRNRARPREVVLCTVTPLTADQNSPKNLLRKRMNIAVRDLAREEKALVAEFGKAVEEVQTSLLEARPDCLAVPDFVHPQYHGQLAMSRELCRILGEHEMHRHFADRVREEIVQAVKKESHGNRISYRLNLDRSVSPEEEQRYELVWTVRADVAKVDVVLPDGWRAQAGQSSSRRGSFNISGIASLHVNKVVLRAEFADGLVGSITVPIPAPWSVSDAFDFSAVWNDTNWLTNAPCPVALSDAKGWKVTTGTWDYTAGMDPDSIDPYQVFAGGEYDSYYARRHIWSDRERDVRVVFSHKTFSASYGVVCWLNGETIVKDYLNRSGRNKVSANAHLHAGWNKLVFHHDHAMWQRQISCALQPVAQGDDLEDLRYSIHAVPSAMLR